MAEFKNYLKNLAVSIEENDSTIFVLFDYTKRILVKYLRRLRKFKICKMINKLNIFYFNKANFDFEISEKINFRYLKFKTFIEKINQYILTCDTEFYLEIDFFLYRITLAKLIKYLNNLD